MIDDLGEMCHRIDGDIGDIFEFVAIVCWDEESMISLSYSIEDGGQESVDPFHHPIQSEFAEKQSIGYFIRDLYIAFVTEEKQCHCHRQIKTSSLFADI